MNLGKASEGIVFIYSHLIQSAVVRPAFPRVRCLPQISLTASAIEIRELQLVEMMQLINNEAHVKQTLDTEKNGGADRWLPPLVTMYSPPD